MCHVVGIFRGGERGVGDDVEVGVEVEEGEVELCVGVRSTTLILEMVCRKGELRREGGKGI